MGNLGCYVSSMSTITLACLEQLPKLNRKLAELKLSEPSLLCDHAAYPTMGGMSTSPV